MVLNSPSSNTCHEAACDAICSATYAMEDLQTNRLVKHKEISCKYLYRLVPMIVHITAKLVLISTKIQVIFQRVGVTVSA